MRARRGSRSTRDHFQQDLSVRSRWRRLLLEAKRCDYKLKAQSNRTALFASLPALNVNFPATSPLWRATDSHFCFSRAYQLAQLIPTIEPACPAHTAYPVCVCALRGSRDTWLWLHRRVSYPRRTKTRPRSADDLTRRRIWKISGKLTWQNERDDRGAVHGPSFGFLVLLCYLQRPDFRRFQR